MRFQDKTVLVVGGNSGIGLATAICFAAEGASVIITGRNERTLADAVTAIPRSRSFYTDIADPQALQPVVEALTAEQRRIDVLFVNAGVGTFAPVREISTELWDQVHNVNLRGAFFATQRVLPLMGRGSSIVYTSSLASVKAPPGGLIYASAKAGLNAMARVLSSELVAEGIRVNVVSPGPVETPLFERNIGAAPDFGKQLREFSKAAVPMQRIGEADEVARAVLFLASDEASFITGVNLFVDGGISAC